MSERSELMNVIDDLRHNPMRIKSAMIRQLEDTYNGELEIMDPMNAFCFLMEGCAVMGAALVRQGETATNYQYPQFAQNFEDLYRHMSDKDYLGRFVVPSHTTLRLIMSKSEVYQRAVATGSGGVRKLTIPRDTQITVADTVFTFQYPIEIRIMAHGGLQIVYDGDKISPIQSLSTNQVDWSLTNYTQGNVEFLMLDVPVLQFKIDTYTAPLNLSRNYKASFEVPDNFYYCRVYQPDTVTGKWVEIKTTHSDQVFDPLTPTALLRVTEGAVEVSIPQIYQTTRLVTQELRIDIYSSKGAIQLPLQNYDITSFVMKFNDYDNDDNGKYTAPLLAMKTIGCIGMELVDSGEAGLTFEELRERMMRNSLGVNDIPITRNQASARLADLGYGVIANVDNITKRILQATRRFEAPSGSTLSSGIGSTIGLLSATFEDLAKLSTVRDNGSRLTLMPETLYNDENGVIKIVEAEWVAGLKTTIPEVIALAVQDKNFLYSPFHYVLDITENTFASRPYYLGNPVIDAKHFDDENDTLGMSVRSSQTSHTFVRNEDGWLLRVLVTSSDEYKALPDDKVFAQLKFRPYLEEGSAFINGTLAGKSADTNERIWEFQINSNWDIDREHYLSISNFSMYEPVERLFRATLTQDFSLIYGVYDVVVEGQQSSGIDSDLGRHLLNENAIGLYQETLTLQLGNNLKGLWNRARSVIGTETYLVYENDVYQTYSKTVHATNPDGSLKIDIVDGKPTLTVLHRAGDVRLDASGNPEVLHYKGSPVLDEFNQPVPSNPRGILRQMELFLLDGAWYFATADADVSYATQAPRTVVDWIEQDIQPLQKVLLDQTELYLRPRSTIGHVEVIVLGNETKLINAEQSLALTYYVPVKTYKDLDLRATLNDNALTTLSRMLTKKVITRDQLMAMLKTQSGDDVIALDLKGLGGDSDYSVITMKDDSAQLVVAKKLLPLPDGKLSVIDDLTVTYIQHTEE